MPKGEKLNKLSQDNYYTKQNKYLSNSKISDFLKDKCYFKDLHLDNTKSKEVTDAMIVGKAVDCWLTSGVNEFVSKYTLVDRSSKKDDEYEYRLNESMHEQITGICRAVEATDAYKDIIDKKYKSQQIFSIDMELGNFKGLCGIPDWYRIDKSRTCFIIDLKTTADADPKKYYYHCKEYGYFRQAAMYRRLIRGKYKNIKEFINLHLVVEKGEINHVFAYELDNAEVVEAGEYLHEIIEQIKEEKDFLSPNPKWEERITIKNGY